MSDITAFSAVSPELTFARYIPDGNSKFGAITIDTTNQEQAVLKYRLFVDGEEVWSWVLTAPARGKKAAVKQRDRLWA